MKRIHISNVDLMEANIEAGAFNSSKELKEVVLEQSTKKGQGTISSHAFSGLDSLKTIKLGNCRNFLNYKIFLIIFPRK